MTSPSVYPLKILYVGAGTVEQFWFASNHPRAPRAAMSLRGGCFRRCGEMSMLGATALLVGRMDWRTTSEAKGEQKAECA